jgi:NADH-quinone oxidoreductase subunit M
VAAMNNFPWLTTLTFLPLAGAIVIAVSSPRLSRAIGFACSLVALGVGILLWTQFDSASGALQFVERHAWVPSIGAEYFVGVDGLGLLLVLLSCLIVPFAFAASCKFEQPSKPFISLLLCLQAGLFGTFTALNFFHWFIFWELSLVPAYFLIKLWGGPNRVQAATQFFIYTLVGSVTLLLSFLALYQLAKTFDFIELAKFGRAGRLASELRVNLGWHALPTDVFAGIIFAGAFLGFAIKVPLFPFHTWLPATYAEAPTSISMVLTGVVSKMGVYGFLRILMPIFPEQMRAMLTPLLWVSVATIIFSAYAAFAQRDLKRMLGYSSINHLGYCLLGIFAALKLTGNDPRWTFEKTAVLNGVLLQVFNHGITASALFCFVGFLEFRGGGIRTLDAFGGLRKAAPIFCGLMGISAFASVGLPGLNGFVGEFLIFKGTFPLATWAAALSVLGLLATAIFLATMLQRIFHGPLPERWASFGDLRAHEWVIAAPAIAIMFAIGIYPKAILGFTNSTVQQMVSHLF